MKIKRRFPNSFSGFETTEHEVSSLEELNNISWIASLSEIKNHMGMFYSPRNYDDVPDLLMSLSRTSEGKIIYFVVGYIFGNGSELGLKNYLDVLETNQP